MSLSPHLRKMIRQNAIITYTIVNTIKHCKKN